MGLPEEFLYRSSMEGIVFAIDPDSRDISRVDSETKFFPIESSHTRTKVQLMMEVITREEAETLLRR
jgi:hypothetical protein